MPEAWLDVPPWRPVRAPRTSDPSSRRVQEYVDVCRQFDVSHAPRYAARGRVTYCNIYVWDATSALGCEIPHWYEPETGEARAVGHGREMSANRMVEYLEAGRGGWRAVSPRDGKARADLGFPTVLGWKNADAGPGHVAMLLPGALIAQAGARCLWLVSIPAGFGELSPQFFTHD